MESAKILRLIENALYYSGWQDGYGRLRLQV